MNGAKRAHGVWERARSAEPNHQYLATKGIRAHGLRQIGPRLLVPVRDAEGDLHGLQRIEEDGEKRFTADTAKAGNFHTIGEWPTERVYIVEGYATGATVHEVTGEPVAVAFDAGNLCAVAEALRAKFPDLDIIIAGDNDHTTEGNPGLTAALNAARSVTGLVAVPELAGDEGTDWNDLASLRGSDAVTEGLQRADAPDALERRIGAATVKEALARVQETEAPEDLRPAYAIAAKLRPDSTEEDHAVERIYQAVKDLGIRKSTIRAEVGRARTHALAQTRRASTSHERREEVPAEIRKEIPAEIREAADALLRSPDILSEMVAATNRLGHQGEVVNRRMAFLAGVAGHTAGSHEDAIHLVVKGARAGGKNELLRHVLDLLPEARVRFLTGVSQQALVYSGGKIEGVLVFQEAEGEEHGEYQIRQAMSEGWLERLTVIDGASRTVRTYVCGSVFTTTTEVALHDENQTRVFDLHIDETRELTRRVIDAVARKFVGEGIPDAERERLLTVWRTALGDLQPVGVVIPYMTEIAERFPNTQLRARRDISRTGNLIRASAVLHQRSRERDDEGRLVASLDDYRMVYPLIQAVLGPSMSGLTEKAKQIAALHTELGGGEKWLDRAELQKKAQTDSVASEKTVRKWATQFVETGLREARKHEGKIQHRALRDVQLEAISLPSPDDLVEGGNSGSTRRKANGEAASAPPGTLGRGEGGIVATVADADGPPPPHTSTTSSPKDPATAKESPGTPLITRHNQDYQAGDLFSAEEPEEEVWRP